MSDQATENQIDGNTDRWSRMSRQGFWQLLTTGATPTFSGPLSDFTPRTISHPIMVLKEGVWQEYTPRSDETLCVHNLIQTKARNGITVHCDKCGKIFLWQ